MRKYFNIENTNSSVLEVSLSNILECCSLEKYYWSLLWIEGSGRSSSVSMPTFEKAVNKSETGMAVDLDRLIRLDLEIDDLQGIVVIGDLDKSKLRRYSDDEIMYDSCSIAIQLVDSSYWEISSDNPEFNNCLNSIFFKEINEVEKLP